MLSKTRLWFAKLSNNAAVGLESSRSICISRYPALVRNLAPGTLVATVMKRIVGWERGEDKMG